MIPGNYCISTVSTHLEGTNVVGVYMMLGTIDLRPHEAFQLWIT